MTEDRSPLELAAVLAAQGVDVLADALAHYTGSATIPLLLIAGLVAGVVFWRLGAITRH